MLLRAASPLCTPYQSSHYFLTCQECSNSGHYSPLSAAFLHPENSVAHSHFFTSLKKFFLRDFPRSSYANLCYHALLFPKRLVIIQHHYTLSILFHFCLSCPPHRYVIFLREDIRFVYWLSSALGPLQRFSRYLLSE